MKIIKKVSVLALSALLMLGGAACGDPSKNSDSSFFRAPRRLSGSEYGIYDL